MNLAKVIASALLKGAIRAYQYLLAPVLPAVCRHHPSCSRYAIEAIERFGPFGGGWLALKRLARCHPWGGEGIDPVPDADADGASRLVSY